MKQLTNNIDIEKCTQAAQGRFDLILMAAVRARELGRGSKSRVVEPHKHTVTALEEIQLGHVGRELLRKVGNKNR